MAGLARYVSTSDLESGWRELSASEQTLAETLIERAEAIVQDALPVSVSELDEVRQVVYAAVVCDMVRRAMPQGVYDTDTEAWEDDAIGGWLRLSDDQAALLGVSSMSTIRAACRYGCAR